MSDLLAAGADPHTTDADGFTALDIAKAADPHDSAEADLGT
eukprot:SAG31_NODE_4974_length_2824_cov_1.164771_1_plen_40_part_10